MLVRRSRGETGAAAILFALCAAILLVVAALVVDLGLARDTRRQSQNSSDASALAAANVMYPVSGSCPSGSAPPCLREAVNEAKEYAEINFGVTANDWTTCPAPPDGYSVFDPVYKCVSFDSLVKPTKVWMVLPTDKVKTGFGVMADVPEIPIGSQARATIAEGESASCGLCFLGPVDAGNADFQVEGAGIHVNGRLDAGPNSQWGAVSIGVAPGTSGKAEVNGGQFTPDWTPAPSITDPWASKANLPPSITGLPQKTDPCGTGGGSGIYGNKTLGNKTTCNLKPGLYVIVGTWLEGNKSVFAGTDVTLYFTCGTKASPHQCGAGESGGKLDAKNGEIKITAPTSGSLAGLAIMYDRKNTQNLELQGNGETEIDGAVYAPNAKLDFNGNSCFGFRGGPIIVSGVIKANGNKACVVVKAAKEAEIYKLPGEISLDR